MLPKNIDRYQIQEEIGRGGMATVLKGYDPHFRRDVAIKLLPREFLHDPQFRQRFQREAQTVAALEHPAIVPVYDYGEAEGQLYLVMRLMNGGSLADRLEKGPLSITETARIFARLAPALDAAHAHGIIHRDLKPGNILFDRWDNPYLADFGIVKLIAGSSTALTATGGLVGTPAYMSPEQVRGVDDLDGRSDIYALGIILFQMLTGKLPYNANTPIGLAFMHVTEPVPHIVEANDSLPHAYACQFVIEQVLAKDRDDRPATAVAFSDTLSTLAAQAAAAEPGGIDTIVEPLPDEKTAAAAEETELPHAVAPEPPAAAPKTEVAEKEAVSDEPEPAAPPPPPPITPPPLPAAGSGGSKKWLFIGGGLLLVAMLLLIGFFALRGGSSETVDVSATAAAIALLAAAETERAVASPPAPDTTTPKPTNTPAMTATPKPTNTPTITPTPSIIGSTRIRQKDGAVMVYVPEGEFMMGSEDWFDDEKPVHAVYLDGYWIDQTEVTNGMYAQCVDDGVCYPPESNGSMTRSGYYGNAEFDDYPVIEVSWEDAKTYCEWTDGRLPTEAEWEKAARWDEENQEARTYPWGEQIDCDFANYRDCVGDTTAVGSYPDGVSPYGTLDMAGNVWEWVYDWYGSDYYQRSPARNPQGADNGNYRVPRGGSWSLYDNYAHAAVRYFYVPANRHDDLGFRCAQE